MNPWNLREEQIRIGLSALKSVALVNGDFAEAEKQLLTAAAHALGTTVDPDSLPVVTPEEAARAFEEPVHRERLVQALIVMALIDQEPSRDEIALIERFADALGIQERRVKYLHQLLDGHLLRLRLDFLRRAPLPQKMARQVYEEKGLFGTLKFARGMLSGKTEGDPEVAWKYKQLGLLPEGTLGREFWKHMTARKFALPGEPGGIPEVGAHHDLTHVLTGYDTDAEGETQIAAFYAGYFKEDPFSFLFMVLVMFHLGVPLGPPQTTPKAGQFDPEKVLRAMKRGSQINTDLTDHWNYWEVMNLPIDEVRGRYNIVPAA
jgi:hypothetical protein